MTYVRSTFRHPALPKNSLGFTVDYYEGALSTLCAGCGHDSINAAIVQACWEMNIEPHRLAKLSGIGCSSKSPAYFLSNSHGFNSVHGRMPSVATGANLANRDLVYFGVSGDGDTASIGMEQFVPLIKAAMHHSGFALLNVISPCVTFNNNVGSTKSYDYVREHVEATATVDFVPIEREIITSYEAGSIEELSMHDGTTIHLH